ncbi:ASCH domain-containing protein [Mitsuaria sp. WAJ17]|uniref:ASCH domain-containing protein n=1 Tax=Mitsuaria sp. WAJ17 TaxID=2761452 RepID=UPI0016009BD5|nr:ASCH domain-containing protein [Mitsuaria sp. WAJ17]MBB2487325.1 ASCH domain-containing protein [Mitsuaria sp. WAJ17]
MTLTAQLHDFWSAFRSAAADADGKRLDERFYEAFFFGDSQPLADELAALVLQGRKRATAGSVWSFEAEGKRLPRPGDLSIVTNWAGKPLCVIETLSVEVLPFREVGAEFAATEGEGDGTLAYWQQGHRAYFNRECERAGRRFEEGMPVACECFRVIYQPGHGAAT